MRNRITVYPPCWTALVHQGVTQLIGKDSLHVFNYETKSWIAFSLSELIFVKENNEILSDYVILHDD